jgi:SAM-dependent methyltransferase
MNVNRLSAVDQHRTNARAWNQTADWYRAKLAEAEPALRSGGSTLHPVESRLLGSLGELRTWCMTAVHLQCAAGMDTISLANLGAARVVGIDIAEDLITIARRFGEDLGAPATFVCADVLDVPGDLLGTADLVYTGKGALHWIFDIKAWGRSVADLLKPGGVALVFDFHPMMWLFRNDQTRLAATGVSYFAPVISYREWPEHHVGELAIPAKNIVTKKLRPWPPSAVIQTLVDAGLQLESFGEYPDTLTYDWTAYPQLPAAERRKIATTYSVLATKPRWQNQTSVDEVGG